MGSWSKESRSIAADAEPVIYTDDGGSGLLDLCRMRFGTSGYEVVCDVRHTVWVRRADGTRSVGLAPWLLDRYSADELITLAETRLAMPVERH